MAPSLTITVYGGVAGSDAVTGEIGGNKILVETSEPRTWFLDFGMGFGRAGRFFDEFLQPRSACGLRDFLRLGLIPPLEGVYRDDLCANEPDLWDRYRQHPHYRRLEHLDGVLLSHAHQDHNGYVGFLKREIPLYTGLMTALIGKGMQDLGGSGEFSYLAPKELTDEGTLKGITGVRHSRPHYICETDENATRALGSLRAFFATHPGAKTKFDPAPLEIADLGSLGIRFFRVDHSIPGSGAFAIHTPIGWIGYSGDLRRHGHSGERTEKFARELAALKPVLLIVEGTRLDETAATQEPAVHQAAREVVRREKGLVIADFSPRNIERLRTFWDIARELGRRFVVTTKDAYLLQQMNVIDSKIPSPAADGLAILRVPRGSRRDQWEKELLETFDKHVTDAAEIKRSPSQYLLSLSYWDIGALIDIDPQRGTYIYSASEAYDEEQKFDHQRLENWLDYFRLAKVGGLPGAEQGPFHASGHIDGPGMEWVIETINPLRILPVHTQKLSWFESRWPDKVVHARYREPVRFD
jgi:ribonuclease J